MVNNTYIECACDSMEHVLCFRIDDDPDPWPPVHVETYLSYWHPWYIRIGLALRYIFKKHCRYGMFDTTVIERDQAEKLIALLRKAYPEKGTELCPQNNFYSGC